MSAPDSLGTQADLELNATAVQICTDEIHKLVGHRPPSPDRFSWTFLIAGDDAPQYTAASTQGIVTQVHSDYRLVSDESREFRERWSARASVSGRTR